MLRYPYGSAKKLLFTAGGDGGTRLNAVWADVRALFDSPCALVVGGRNIDGAPVAAWGWGPSISAEAASVRLVVESEIRFSVGRFLAINAGDLVTSRSVQIKGRIAVAEPPTPDDLYRLKRHVDGFRRALEDIDGVAHNRTEGIASPRTVITFPM